MAQDLILVQNFHLQMEVWEKNIFGADVISSVHIGNKNKDILILAEGPTQRSDDTTLTAEAKHSINITQSGKRFVFSLHYNGSNSFLFGNATKIYQFKAKDSEIKQYTLCLGNILKDLTISNIKKELLPECQGKPCSKQARYLKFK